MIADNIDFMFYTRTLSEDYRVFADDGNETLDYAEYFEPITEIAQVKSDDERSAVVYTEDGNIYVAAFGLLRGAKDRARRDIRFSFCVVLPKSNMNSAMRIFSRVKNEWDETGNKAGSFIKERPITRKDWKGRDVKGEDVKFNHGEFLQWLVSKPANIEPPKAGYMLKYFADTGEIVNIGSKDEDEDSGEGYTWILTLLLAGVIGVGLLMWYLMPGKSPSKPPEQPSKSQDEQSSLPENSSGTSQDITSSDKEAANGGHNNINNNNRAYVAPAQEADNERAGSKGRISPNSRSNDQNQGGDDTRE